MKTQTTMSQRQHFYERHERGETYAEIAADSEVSLECVRYWCRRLRVGGSPTTRHYRAKTGLLSDFLPLVRYVILRLRLEHLRWGPQRIREKLGRHASLQSQRLPSRAQIGRYLHQWPCFRRRRKHVRPAPTQHAQLTRVYQCWQFDFKMGIPLDDGTQVNLHTIRDPVGEVCIAAVVTPAGPQGRKPRRVTLRAAQNTVRKGFARWHTLPEALQTDNEAVYVGDTARDFPGLFTLWLVGLGIEHWVIRPGKPTDNAEVERCHQTLYNYAIAGCDASNQPHLQACLDRAVDELAFDLPSQAAGCAGRPPVAAHPELLQPQRLFALEQELATFDLKRVDAYLAGCLWQRTVGHTGQICIGGWHQYYSVGRTYAGHQVMVCFDPTDRNFVFFEAQAPYAEIGRPPARNLTTSDLTGLSDPESAIGPQQLALFSDQFAQGVSC